MKPPVRPAVIDRLWYSIDWDVAAIWGLDLPRGTVPIAPLMWHLDVPIWPDETGAPYRVTPRQVLEAGAGREFDRIGRADPSYPIEVLKRGGVWMILDGVHRLAKVHAAGGPALMCALFPAVRCIGFSSALTGRAARALALRKWQRKNEQPRPKRNRP